ncbi:hypothetical protein JYT36_00575, partial [Bacteroidales bacterium AH-315-N07]|nr:hypothetical protein [Bacteroidales bacterium AH-315-N07]
MGSNSVYPQLSQNNEYLLSKKWVCGADEYHKKRLYEDFDYKRKTQEFENKVYNILLNSGYVFYKISPKKNVILTIPVVVHIIHNNGSENIADTQVVAGIQHLNDAFRNRGDYDASVGVDTEIEFCLAKRDENGNYTTGITRTQSTLTDFNRDTQDADLKALVIWDPTKYMNIWVVRSIASSSFPQGVAGYANGPGGHGSPTDGIVIVKSFFGWIPILSGVNAHEVGHYLALAHTFSGGCSNNNCLTQGDRICDTPPDKSTAPVSCDASINTCTTDEDDISANNPFRPVALGGLGDQDDMTINYMDYNYQCKKAFSQGQTDRMRLSLTGPRNSLLDTDVCIDLCHATPIITSFSASDSVVAITTLISFTNLSSGSDKYQWTINGQEFSTARDTLYYFNTLGTFIIRLYTHRDGYPVECGMEDSINIEVFCPSVSSFTENKNQIPINYSVSFTNTSTAISYQWFIRDSLVDTATHLTYTFNNLGDYAVYLVAFTGACYDTSATVIIDVYCPVTTQFTTPSSTLVPGDSQTFTNTSSGAISYEWFVDDTSMGTTVDLTYQFNKPGTNRVYLVSYNGVCLDTSNSSYIQVGNCNSKEATYWYFGDRAGIKFENDTVIPQYQNPMFTWEGTATISDKNTGNLLFYTEGDTLFNANHQPMPNGTGLKGDLSSTQAALIIPMPGDGGKYYVFTVDASSSNPNRFPNDSVCTYSIVDMTLDGGLGDIIPSTKNTTLFTPTSEQIIGIRH